MKNLIKYFLIFVFVFVFDRLAKYLVFKYLSSKFSICSYIYLQLAINRGISWGLFNSSDTMTFSIVTLSVIFVTAYLTKYAFIRAKNGYFIIGDVLVLAGAISNIIDRFLYNGVIDFIIFDFKFWEFPVFNIADAAIVLGVSIMILQLLFEDDKFAKTC